MAFCECVPGGDTCQYCHETMRKDTERSILNSADLDRGEGNLVVPDSGTRSVIDTYDGTAIKQMSDEFLLECFDTVCVHHTENEAGLRHLDSDLLLAQWHALKDEIMTRLNKLRKMEVMYEG